MCKINILSRLYNNISLLFLIFFEKEINCLVDKDHGKFIFAIDIVIAAIPEDCKPGMELFVAN